MSFRARWRIAGLAVLGLAAAATAYAIAPRKPDLFAFDPASIGRIETAMWRDYYEQRYLDLFAHLYDLSRTQYGFSPWDSARIAVAAARAAKAFQPSRSRAEANAALPFLVDYFRLLSIATPVRLDVDAPAAAELDWWQARREAAGPDTYGPTIARVTTLLYGVDNENIRESGVLRARAMAYRDVRAAGITDADWSAIGSQLTAAYGLLKKGLPGTRPAP
jgi:hypothetical protein